LPFRDVQEGTLRLRGKVIPSGIEDRFGGTWEGHRALVQLNPREKLYSFITEDYEITTLYPSKAMLLLHLDKERAEGLIIQRTLDKDRSIERIGTFSVDYIK